MFHVVVVFKYFLRVFLSVLGQTGFRKNTDLKYNNVKHDEASVDNDHAEVHPQRSKSEELLRRCCRDLPVSKQRYIHQRLRCPVPPAVPCQGDENNTHPNGIVQGYQNVIRTLKGQCDEKSTMIVKGMVELEKLKCALKRTRRSNKNLQRFNRNLKRSSEALKAKCRCTASKLSAATRAFDRHTSTIGSYEKCCSRWASELSDIVGEHRVEPLTTRELFEFARRSLSEFVKIKSQLDANEYEQHFVAAMSNMMFNDHHCSPIQSTIVCSLGIQTDSSIDESIGVQTDFAAGESVGVQTDLSAGESVGVQTNLSAGESVGVQTNLSAGESVGVQTDFLVGESVSVQTDFSVGKSVGIQTNMSYHQTVGVQTHFNKEDDSIEIASDEEDYSPMQDIVAELLEKFGHDTRLKTNRYNFNALLVKIQTHGLQSLFFQELAFLHRQIGVQSARLFEKYKPLLDLAKKRFTSLRSNTIRYKYDIVHIFSTLDTVLEIKNKELAELKNNSAKNQITFKTLLDEETQKRITAENTILEVRAESEQLIKSYRL